MFHVENIPDKDLIIIRFFEKDKSYGDDYIALMLIVHYEDHYEIKGFCGVLPKEIRKLYREFNKYLKSLNKPIIAYRVNRHILPGFRQKDNYWIYND